MSARISSAAARQLGIRRNKYGVRQDAAGKLARTVDGIVFDSQAEARRYADLKVLLRAGQIHDLELQPVYPLTINGVLVAHYRGDFRYLEPGRGVVVEDVKGMRTPEYRLKRKLMAALYSITIAEIAA